jgi:3-dehydroquinate synthase
MNNITVKIAEKSAYEIIIGKGLLADINVYLEKFTKAKKFLVVTNSKVFEIYKDVLKVDNSSIVVLEDGEEFKNLASLEKIFDAAIEFKLERKDCIVAFGGGVTGDLAGFAAATYLRGVDFVQIPTTLLAQVDSSVGGKVAVNHKKGKNLIGAFYQPKLVLSDISLLKTLDERQLKTGLAEVLKYAFIEKSCGHPLNYRLFDFLHANVEKIYSLDSVVTEQLINICCTLKASVVEKDEKETGMRAVLNFGHTFGHAVESLTDYKRFTHGEAVAIGMKMAVKLALSLEMIDEDYVNAVNELIDKFKLVGEIPHFDSGRFIDAMSHDKKVDSEKIRFVLPDANFSVKIVDDVPCELISRSLA